MGSPTVGISAYDMAATDLLDLAVAADEAGFDAIWLGEHVLLPVDYETPHPTKKEAGVQHHSGPIVALDTELLEPLVELAAIAALTTRLRVATGVYILPLRHPLATARAACTLQEVSRGRFMMGLGVGWLQEEFDAMDVPFAERAERFEETIDILRMAWAGGPFKYGGNHFSFREVQVTPRPTDVPLILGGNTGRALERAATLGQGWFSSGTPTFDDARRLQDRLHAIRTGHSLTAPFRCYFRVEGCDPAVIDQYLAAGIDDVVVWADQVWHGPTLEARRETLHAAAVELGLG
jgi:probable F420-dependent oxidoreductase